MKISFVYFDVGGVVIKDFFNNPTKWQELKDELGITPEKDALFTSLWREHEKAFCTGRDVNTFLPELKSQFELQLPPSYSLLDGFVKRFESNPELWSVITAIKQQAKIGLLTNMYPRMLDAIKAKKILPEVTWEVVVDSSIAGLQKPDKAFFELAQQKAGVPHEEILFVDNADYNIAVAQDLGWQTVLYDIDNVSESNSKLATLLEITAQ